jgi:hypothetical protein
MSSSSKGKRELESPREEKREINLSLETRTWTMTWHSSSILYIKILPEARSP